MDICGKWICCGLQLTTMKTGNMSKWVLIKRLFTHPPYGYCAIDRRISHPYSRNTIYLAVGRYYIERIPTYIFTDIVSYLRIAYVWPSKYIFAVSYSWLFYDFHSYTFYDPSLDNNFPYLLIHRPHTVGILRFSAIISRRVRQPERVANYDAITTHSLSQSTQSVVDRNSYIQFSISLNMVNAARIHILPAFLNKMCCMFSTRQYWSHDHDTRTSWWYLY